MIRRSRAKCSRVSDNRNSVLWPDVRVLHHGLHTSEVSDNRNSVLWPDRQCPIVRLLLH